jgi:methyl-accepting chemotaxis protein
MSANSEETAAQANMVASASEQVTRNVSTVATAAEEMSASAKEIAKNASEAQGGRAGGEGRRGDEQHRWQTG